MCVWAERMSVLVCVCVCRGGGLVSFFNSQREEGCLQFWLWRPFVVGENKTKREEDKGMGVGVTGRGWEEWERQSKGAGKAKSQREPLTTKQSALWQRHDVTSVESLVRRVGDELGKLGWAKSPSSLSPTSLPLVSFFISMNGSQEA